MPGQELANRGQGLYADGVQGLLIEENVFDHNGWNESVAGAGPNMFNQSMYLNTLNTGVQVIGNIIAECVRARPAGAGRRDREGQPVPVLPVRPLLRLCQDVADQGERRLR